jgi:hypothetical protein
MGKPTGNPNGRPSKITPAIQAQIAEYLFLAFTDEQIATLVGIDRKTIERARHGRFCPSIKIAELKREAIYRRKIWAAKGFWQGAAWFLERKYPQQFARPEIQLSWNNNYTQNNLSINISSGDAKQIEAEAKPVRDAVSSMFEKYRPQSGNGNGDITQHETG